MNYLKASEVVQLFGVGKRTVYHWIDAAKDKKIGLEVAEVKGKTYVLNTPLNMVRMKDLAEKGVKFKNKKLLQVISPKKEFYQTYSEDQIIDILKNLEVNNEIPLKYTYMDGGAVLWNEYSNKMWHEEDGCSLPNTVELLHFNLEYIYSLVESYDQVNIVDIGPGNAFPVRSIIDFFLKKKLLRKYIAIDYSPDMLKIAVKNLEEWFGDALVHEEYVADITSYSFQALLAKNTIYKKEKVSCVNIILYLGGTIENDKQYAQQLGLISKSLGIHDVFVLEQGLDKEHLRVQVLLGKENAPARNIGLFQGKALLELLNFRDDFYTIERYYDEKEKAKKVCARLQFDVKLNIATENIKRTIYLKNKETINFWRYNSHSNTDVYNEMLKAGFDVKHMTTSLNEESIMLVASIKSSERVS